MESVERDRSNEAPGKSLTRCQKLLQQEVLACEDPICCCEAEPRWLRFDQDDPASPSEWESVERTPSGEL